MRIHIFVHMHHPLLSLTCPRRPPGRGGAAAGGGAAAAAAAAAAVASVAAVLSQVDVCGLHSTIQDVSQAEHRPQATIGPAGFTVPRPRRLDAPRRPGLGTRTHGQDYQSPSDTVYQPGGAQTYAHERLIHALAVSASKSRSSSESQADEPTVTRYRWL
jgi:hypothetical protein